MRRRSYLVVCVAALTACGIDQGGIRTQPRPSSPPPARTTLVSGPITGFGSVLVNDLTLETSQAQIIVDGRAASEGDLREGQIIRAIASNTGGVLRALLIEHEESLIGPITAIASGTGELTVLGQTISTDASTRFDAGGALGDFGLDEVIVVSGFKRPSGAIAATFIGRAAPGQAFQITASIVDVDVANLSFGLGALTVDYSEVVMLDVQGGVPETDAIVEVKGTQVAGDILIADSVRGLDFQPGALDARATELTDSEAPFAGADAATALDANFMGFVSVVDLPGRILLDDIEVAIGGDTVFVGGTVDDLDVGLRVQVEGEIPSSGSITARRITLF